MAGANSKKMLPNGKKLGTKSFAGIPRAVMESEEFVNAPNSAIRLLLDLAYQYRGRNNGDLTTAFTVLKKRGWKSKGTLSRAQKYLLSAELIVMTRAGVFTNPGGRCALFALAWQPIDECGGKLDVKPTSTPPRKF